MFTLPVVMRASARSTGATGLMLPRFRQTLFEWNVRPPSEMLLCLADVRPAANGIVVRQRGMNDARNWNPSP